MKQRCKMKRKRPSTHMHITGDLYFWYVYHIYIYMHMNKPDYFPSIKRPWDRGTVVHCGFKVWSVSHTYPCHVIECGTIITRSFFHKYSQKASHSSPTRARYRVSFVDPAYYRYYASVPVIIHVISCNIVLRYNGTRLYMAPCHLLLGFEYAYTCRWLSDKKDVTPLC